MAKIMQCSYINCKNDSNARPMFSFPSVTDSRHEAWIQNCGNESLRDCTQWELLHKYVCVDHFDKSLITYIISTRGLVKNILSADAIPTPYTETTSKDIENFEEWDCAPVFNEVRYAGMGLNAVTIQDVASLQPEDYEVIESQNNDYGNVESRLTGGECYQVDYKQEVFKCNICLQDIIGFRYRCCSCLDFDICASCEARGVHPTHLVLRIPVHYSASEVGDVIEAVRLVLIHTKTNKQWIVEPSNDEMETVDPLGNGCFEISQREPMTGSDPLLILSPTRSKKVRKEKKIEIEYSPPKQRITPFSTKPLSNKPLVDKPQNQKESLAPIPPKPREPMTGSDPLLILSTTRSKKVRKEKKIEIEYSPPKQRIAPFSTKPLSNKPLVDKPQNQKESLAPIPPKPPLGCLKQLPANVLPPPNAIIKKIRIGLPQEPLAPPPKKPVKLKLVGKKKYLPVALDAIRRKGETKSINVQHARINITSV